MPVKFLPGERCIFREKEEDFLLITGILLCKTPGCIRIPAHTLEDPKKDVSVCTGDLRIHFRRNPLPVPSP